MGNTNSETEIIFSRDVHSDLGKWITRYREEGVFVVTEGTVNRLWLQNEDRWLAIPRVVLPPGEVNKKLTSVETVWAFLSRAGATRKSLLINVGGGMLTDIGGFAASTFKRGIGFLNIPTTLLAQVDASVGGKTGFNFNGLKNEIGSFAAPAAVLIWTPFLTTLGRQDLLSGYAEMVKHGLIFSPRHLEELRAFDTGAMKGEDLHDLVRDSVAVKEHFVTADPQESHIRKALNFGHTIGHALESLALDSGKEIPHGYAVAWGMIAELFLSSVCSGFAGEDRTETGLWLKKLYGQPPFSHSDFDRIYDRMLHDKKNETGRINFTLLSAPGQTLINQECSKQEILRALNYLLTL